eukprot:5903391-Ditylum_brightwellii.AAC.1
MSQCDSANPLAFAVIIGIDVDMHGTDQHNLDELTHYLYNTFITLFDTDTQAGDYLHFVRQFGVIVR